MTKRYAFIGDIHGCPEEFEQLLAALSHLSIDEIWLVGDLVDRGPDSGAVVQIAMERGIKSVMGNHENSILTLWDKKVANPDYVTDNIHKMNTLNQLTQAHVDYMKIFPILHYIEDINMVVVHGGLFPHCEMWNQPKSVIRAQLIRPETPGDTRWWGPEAAQHKSGKTEEESYGDGYRRWYDIYDGPWNVVYGHSVFNQPLIVRNPGAGTTFGIDTGNVFGGLLTALIYGPEGFYFIGIPPVKIHCPDKLGKFLVR